MTKNKYNKAIWGNRIKKNTSLLFQEIGSSIDIDKRLYKEDIKGSLAHVEMLGKQKFTLLDIFFQLCNNFFDCKLILK